LRQREDLARSIGGLLALRAERQLAGEHERTDVERMGVPLVMNVRRNRANLNIVEAILKKGGFEFASFIRFDPSGDPHSLVRAPRNLQTAHHAGTRNECIERAFHVVKILHADELAGSVEADQVAHPGERRDIRDRVFASP
jgi:hypothetical protein